MGFNMKVCFFHSSGITITLFIIYLCSHKAYSIMAPSEISVNTNIAQVSISRVLFFVIVLVSGIQF